MEEVKVKLFPRRLARSAARAELDRAGVTGYNKERTGLGGAKLPSMFSVRWRDLAVQAVSRPKPKKLKKGARE